MAYKTKKIDKNFFLLTNFVVSFFIFCLILIKGERLWSTIRGFLFGIFGINSIILPFFLFSFSFLKIKNGSVNKFRFILFYLLLLNFGSLIAVFSLPKSDSIGYFYYQGIKNAGILSGIIGTFFSYHLGLYGARSVLILSFFFMFVVFLKIDLIDILKKVQVLFILLKNIFCRYFNNFNQTKCSYDSGSVKEVVNTKSLARLRDSFNETSLNNESNEDEEGIAKVTAAFVEKLRSEQNLTKTKLEKNISGDNYKFPNIDFLNLPEKIHQGDIASELNTNGKMLIDTLSSFNVRAKIVDISRGPAITRYEIQPASGVKVSKITTLSDDIALNLAALGVRIEAPIPGRSAVGVEIPNKIVSMVTVREIIESDEFINNENILSVVLGKDISGKPVVTDLSKMPHLLIAGSTGAGKSVCVNSFIISLLYKASPEDVKILMIDPKVVELGVYNDIPHLLVPVVTDPRKSAGALNWAVNEMLNRYKIFAEIGVRDITSYNSFLIKNKNNEELNKMAKIVIIIDELSDLMIAAPSEIENYICRLTQMARAAGIHLVIATQRPSVDVITGIIKANVPSRIALAVSSQVDSRTILDMGGAEKLLGRGDMLFSPVGSIKPMRVQGCYVTETEIERVVRYVKGNSEFEYDKEVAEGIERGAENGLEALQISSSDDDKDSMISEAIKCVIESGQASTSLLQRKLRVGYARAGRLVDEMEKMGIVGPHEGSKPRKVIMTYKEFLEKSINN